MLTACLRHTSSMSRSVVRDASRCVTRDMSRCVTVESSRTISHRSQVAIERESRARHTLHMDRLSTTDSLPALAMSVEDIAARCALGRSYVYAQIRNGSLPARRAGARLVVLQRDAEAWLEGLPSASSCAIFMKGSRQ
jgi:excisionase family DNA binding protein